MMIYEIISTNTFKKEFLKLSQKQKNKLKGKMESLRDCHIEPNLVLIYEKNEQELILTAIRINKHNNLGLSAK